MSACGSPFKVKLQPHDQIIIIAKGECDYETSDVARILTDKSLVRFSEVLSSKMPYIRINVKEHSSSSLARPRLYKVPIVPNRDGLQIAEVAWISNDDDSGPIMFDSNGIVAGELLNSTKSGYADGEEMHFYQTDYIELGEDNCQTGCIVGLWKHEHDGNKRYILMNFIVAPQSSFTVVRRNGGIDGAGGMDMEVVL